METLCLYLLQDGTVVCRACDSPPEAFVSRRMAPQGTPKGDVTEQYGHLFPPNTGE